MTSQKQFEANGRNALRSTGPKSTHGKRRSRRNALRHGLTAETIVEAFENPKHYKKFQAAIVSDYAPHSTVEYELVLRVASLLWRLRRATLVETGLFEIQATIPLSRPSERSFAAEDRAEYGRVHPLLIQSAQSQPAALPQATNKMNASTQEFSGYNVSASWQVAQCYLRLNNLDNAVFERIGHYEARLWRQLAQTLMMLDLMKRSMPLARSELSRRVRKFRASFDESRLTRFD